MLSFRDPVTNVLKAYGYCATNAPGDLVRDEPDDFTLEPGKWQFVGGAWVPAVPAWAPIKAAEMAAYIETREKMCARVAGIGQRLARAGDTAGALSCDAVVNALLDVPAHTSVIDAADITSLRLAIKTRYLAAVGLASLSAKAEFRRYDK